MRDFSGNNGEWPRGDETGTHLRGAIGGKRTRALRADGTERRAGVGERALSEELAELRGGRYLSANWCWLVSELVRALMHVGKPVKCASELER